MPHLPFIITGAVLTVVLLLVLLSHRRIRIIDGQSNTIQEKIRLFETIIHKYDESYISHSDEIKLSTSLEEINDYLVKLNIPKGHYLYEAASTNINIFKNLHQYVENHNETFIDYEKRRCNDLLSDIDGKSLDDQQRTAVVTDEDHNLVLAGAGSGKTLTIAGKVKYLVNEKHIVPSEILLISFTRKAAEEMTGRISGKLGIPVAATTFHKLGLDIIKTASGKCPDVFDDLPGYVTEFFEKHLVDNQDTVKDLIEYFAYYLNIPADLDKHPSLGETYEHQKGLDFETIKSKYEKSVYAEKESDRLKAEKKTLHGETVKSLEEVTIANFLFLNGVNYEYEKKYPFKTDTSSHKPYHPDFYLPDYDIYLEHFGIDKNGHLPWLSRIEEQKYLEGIAWKRQLHKENGTRLLETYSYYSHEGVLIEKLSALLKKNGVIFTQPDYLEIFGAVYGKKSDKYLSEFKKLCGTFITLFKSRGFKAEDLGDLCKKESSEASPFFAQRTRLFVNIIRPIIETYEAYLKENHAVDFSDMIIRATDHIANGDVNPGYRYIIVDEYQDISVARYKLVKAILDSTGAHLFCVGDDWQSIYRFAGSDISLFTEFEKYYGYSKTMKIERTYRNSQQLIDNVERFVMENPSQLRKSLVSAKSIDYPISFWFYSENPFIVLKRMIDKLIADYGSKSSILLLGRTTYDAELLKNSGLFDMRVVNDGPEYVYRESRETPISFLTVHKSKGLEADNVILLNFENSVLGFPNKLSDDPILNLVLSSADSCEYAEERRLLYVALTRTRNRVFILTDNNKPSEFLNSFKPSETVYYVGQEKGSSEFISCPRCKTGHLTIRKSESSGTYFVGCSNYPQCEYTVHDVSIMNTNKRCPRCGGFLVQRKGEKGEFLGCTNYPQCNYTQEI